jgi:hypothetical protein
MRVGEAVNGFSEMVARQISLHNWRVLSWRSGNITAHKVHTGHLKCTCKDQAMNKEGPQEVCDHLAKALFHAPQKLDFEARAQRDVAILLNELERTVEELSEPREAESEPDPEPDPEPVGAREGKQTDHVKAVSTWLEECGVPPEKVRVWKADSGSIHLTTAEYMGDEDFRALIDAVDHPSITDLEDYEWAIPSSAVPDVVL